MRERLRVALRQPNVGNANDKNDEDDDDDEGDEGRDEENDGDDSDGDDGDENERRDGGTVGGDARGGEHWSLSLYLLKMSKIPCKLSAEIASRIFVSGSRNSRKRGQRWTESQKIIYAKKLLRGSAKLFVTYE